MHRYQLFTLILSVLLAPKLMLGADGDILNREEIHQDEHSIVERVTYESDGLKIIGYLAYPSAAAEPGVSYPCLMFNRGGNRDYGSMTDERARRMGPMIAGWGYVFFASNYRGSAGSEGKEEFGGDDVNDVLNALRIFDQLEFADEKRIGMWGHSRGGMMTYLSLMRTNRIDAAIASSTVSDMRMTVKNRPAMEENVLAELAPDYETDRDGAIARRSAVMRAGELPKSTPILIAHGLSDWRVSPIQALNMSAALLEHAIPHRLVMYEGGDHGISEHRAGFHAEVRDWLDRYVRDGSPLPDTTPHGP